MEPAHVRQRALGVAAKGYKLGNDGDGDLFRCNSADIETDGRMDTIEERGIEAFARELAKDSDGFPPGADHADVASLSLHGPAENAHIVAVTTGADNDPRRFAGREFSQRFFEVLCNDLARIGETFDVSVQVAVVGDDAIEAGIAGGLVELEGDVAGAKDI